MEIEERKSLDWQLQKDNEYLDSKVADLERRLAAKEESLKVAKECVLRAQGYSELGLHEEVDAALDEALAAIDGKEME